MNEPQLELTGGVNCNDVIEFHKNVTIAVKKKFPEASIGGQLVTTSLIISTDMNPSTLGDFDGDGDVDLIDLDYYNGKIGKLPISELENLDLDSDGDIHAVDLMQHYTTLVETSNDQKGTFAGDLNLDGTASVLGDAFLLVGNLGLSNEPVESAAAFSVPEPGGILLTLLPIIGTFARR